MFYVDTSAAIAAHTRGAATERIQAWLGRCAAGELAASRWMLTEFSSALSLKLRTGALTAAQRADVMASWAAFVANEVHLLNVTAETFETAAVFAARHELGLRAGDALHLAVAAAHGCTLVTLDDRMAKAGLELGVPVATIG